VKENLTSAKRARPFTLNSLLMNKSMINENDYLTLDLFESNSYLAKISKISTNVNGTLSIMAKLDGLPFSFCIIAISYGKVSLTIDIPEHLAMDRK